MKIKKAWLVAGALFVSACGGKTIMHLGDTGSDNASGGGGSGGSSVSSGVGGGVVSSGAGGTSIPMGDGCKTAGPSQALWLTNPEYDNTVRDLLGYDGPSLTAKVMFADDSTEIGFRRQTEDPLGHTAPSEVRFANFVETAGILVDWARTNLDAIVACDVATRGEQPCVDEFIARFGLRAYRRPLTTGETSDFQSTYADARSMGAFADGILAIVAHALTSSQFLEIEVPKARGSYGALDAYAMASRLSYFIYRSMPDQVLFDAAAADGLATSDDVAQQARRMLADPKAHAAVLDFFTEWLSLDRLADGSLTKDANLYPDFPTLSGYMRTETRMFGEATFFGDGLLPTLLTSEFTWINRPLADLYGVMGGPPGTDFQLAPVDKTKRGGILTQASFLSLTSNANQSSPTKRGAFVNEQILCRALPPPPPNVNVVPPVEPGQSTRDRLTAHRSSATCAACHAIMDGIGFGFEEFDAVGRYRTIDNGVEVDASGIIGLDGISDVRFNGAVELTAKLAASGEVRDCFARQWFHFALARDDVDEDACSLTAIQQGLRRSPNMQDMVVAIATSTPFRYASW